jgi:hypothetical protein
LVWVADETVVFGLMIAGPIMLVGWLLAQSGFRRSGVEAGRATASRSREIAEPGLPKSAPVAITLARSCLVGRAGAGLVPAEALAAALQLDAVPHSVLL